MQIKSGLLNILFLLLSFSTFAQTQKEPEVKKPITRILFVFDGSQSMHGRWESGSKIAIAQKLMAQMLDSLQVIDDKQTFQLALRVYGHQYPVPPQNCNDTRLEVPFAFGNVPRIKKKLRSIVPKGTTPIARSLSRASTDFPPCENCRNVIILITDGIEACDEDPCIVSRNLQKKGIILKPFVIGIGLDVEFKETFECVGNYFDATDEKTFQKVLGVVVSQALDNTTAQINLLDIYNNPTETNVAITLTDKTSGAIKDQLVHTLNFKGNPDTVILDPLVNYRMTVHTIPEVVLDSITIYPGTHTHIGAETPRGTLDLRSTGSRGDGVNAIIREHGKMKTLNVQNLDQTQKYIVGYYDIEFLTLPRIYQYKVEVNQSATTRVAIPPSGNLNIQSPAGGYGSILVETENGVEWIVDLSATLPRQSFKLQPGQYQVIFRSKKSQQTSYSKAQRFSISSGKTTILRLN